MLSKNVMRIVANLIVGMMNIQEQPFIGAIGSTIIPPTRILIEAVLSAKMAGVVTRLAEEHARIMAACYIGSSKPYNYKFELAK